MPRENFKSAESYRRYRAYTHIHGIPTHSKEVCIGKGKSAKCHTVKHSKLGKKKSKRRVKR